MNGIREELSGIGGTYRIATEHKIQQDQLKLVEREKDKAFRLAEKEAEKALRLAEKEAEKAIRLAEIEAEKAARLTEKDADKAERTKARRLLQRQETYLDDDSLSAILDLFNDNPILGETYIEIERPSLRRVWITKTLLKHGFPPPASAQPE